MAVLVWTPVVWASGLTPDDWLSSLGELRNLGGPERLRPAVMVPLVLVDVLDDEVVYQLRNAVISLGSEF